MIKKETITNLSYLKDASNHNQEFIKEMIQIFLRQTPVYLIEIKQLAIDEDWTKMKALLHKLKPTMPMMGISEGENLVRVIESDVKLQTNLNEVMPKLMQLEDICLKAYVELKLYLE